MFKKITIAFLLTAFTFTTNSSKTFAQIERPSVGKWNTYLPYASVIDFDSYDLDNFYCISKSSFFTYNLKEDVTERYSKANGMSDVEMAFIKVDPLTQKVALVYQNGNIDIYKDGVFENIPDVKISTVPGDKTLYGAHAHNGMLYIASGIGMIIVNIDKKEVTQQVPFYSGSVQGLVKSITSINNNLYVATNIGLFSTNVNNPQIFNYNTWTKISDNEINIVTAGSSNVFAAFENKIYKVENNALSLLDSTSNPVQTLEINHTGDLWVLTQEIAGAAPYALKMSATGNLIDSVPGFYANRFMDEGDGYFWASDSYSGLRRKSTASTTSEWNNISPKGPSNAGAQNVWAKNGEIWIAHGSKDYSSWFPGLNQDAFSKFDKWNWRNWKWDILSTLPSGKEYSQTDAIAIVKEESSNTAYVGMLNGGLVEVAANGDIKTYKNGYLGQNTQGDTGSYRVTGLALDKDNNLWITQSMVQNPLRVKTANGTWYNYNINGLNHLNSIAIDDLGQKWFGSGYMGTGIAILNDNNTLDNPNDDFVRVLRKGKGNGNLPHEMVNTIAKDKNGEMWVGTESGIGIFGCGADIKAGICDADLRPLVTKGFNFANYMFESISVKSIAVDAGNRKWVGTSVGLFLLTEDGSDIIEQFTETNSPLLSNAINSVNIDPVTGEVFISTSKGLCSFGGSAIDAGWEVSKPLFVYPNPVPSGYSGMISIKGMTESSNVKITDINGQLVYQATSNGAQLSWNGRDYNGRKVQSGVYLIFVVGKDGTNKANGKFIIHE